MAPKAWWIVGPDGLPLKDGRVYADTYEEADRILFHRLCHAECPVGSTLEEEDTYEQVRDEDIVSIEEVILTIEELQ